VDRESLNTALTRARKPMLPSDQANVPWIERRGSWLGDRRYSRIGFDRDGKKDGVIKRNLD
jgi:hypothetical protein